MVAKILIEKKGKKFFVKDIGKDFHCQYGVIKSDMMISAGEGDILTSNIGKEFFIFSPSFIDIYGKIKRGPQIIPAKDIGAIIANTGINKNSIVLDSGSGSGANACFLAMIAKKVYTYEIREDFFNTVRKNIEFLGIKNIVSKNKDIYEGIDEKNIDVIILDLPEPWKAIGHAEKALKPGGFLVAYSPCIPQVMDFTDSLPDSILNIRTIEIMERHWEITKRKVRPKSLAIGHSGFLSINRKIGK